VPHENEKLQNMYLNRITINAGNVSIIVYNEGTFYKKINGVFRKV